MGKISVHPDERNDPTNRYMMPEVNLKAEGGGNGKRTVFLNITDIAKALSRDVNSIMTYLSSILGCKFENSKDGRWILYGDHEKKKIQDKVDEYISIFVICKECQNPDTVYVLNEKKNVCLTCDACCKVTLVSLNKNTTKILSLIEKELKKK